MSSTPAESHVRVACIQMDHGDTMRGTGLQPGWY